MPSKSPGLSVVIPARNEAETIGLVLTDCSRVLQEMGIESEVIVVDDGSTDGTQDCVSEFDCKFVVNKGPKHGKGIALRLGFAAARYSTLVMLDADYSHRAEDIPALWAEFQKGYGLVVGDRFIGGSDEYTFARSFGNRFLTTVFSSIHGVQMNDCLNGLKMFDHRVVDTFVYTAKDFSIEIELLANTRRLDLSVGQVRSHERSRAGGVPKSFALKHGFSFLFRILLERFRTPERTQN